MISEKVKAKRAADAARDAAVVRSFYETGDEALLGPLLGELRGRFESFLYSNGVRNDVFREDIIQEALTEVLLSLRKHNYTATGTVAAWAMKLCWRRYADHAGNKKDKPSRPSRDEDPFLLIPQRIAVIDEEIEDEAARAKAESRGRELVKAVTQVVLTLDLNSRNAVLLHFYHGLTPLQGAEQLGINPNHFIARLYRGIDVLREWAQKQDAPTAEVYAALSHINTGNLFRIAEKPKSTRSHKAKVLKNKHAEQTPLSD